MTSWEVPAKQDKTLGVVWVDLDDDPDAEVRMTQGEIVFDIDLQGVPSPWVIMRVDNREAHFYLHHLFQVLGDLQEERG